MKAKKVISLLLVAAMSLSMVACGSGDTSSSSDDSAKSESNGSSTPLVIASDAVSQKFSPFFAESVPDVNVVDRTQLMLLNNDRAGNYIYDGVDGYTAEYNGTEYTYYTPANIDVQENEDGTMSYEFTL